MMVFYCFCEMLKDLVYIPYFTILSTFMFWRAKNLYKNLYIYNEDINKEIEIQRELLIKLFYKGLWDYIYFFQLLIIVITLIRLQFFYLIVSKNRNKKDGISFKKCISITFKELLRDIPYFFLSLFIVLIAPWRIISILRIYKGQFERIPCFDKNKDLSNNIPIKSKRNELIILVSTVFCYDLINLFMLIILTLSIYKLPFVLSTVKQLYQNAIYSEINERNYGIQELMLKELLELVDALKIASFILVILVLCLRVKSCYRRIISLNSRRKARALMKKYKIKNENSEKKGLNSLSFNAFSIVLFNKSFLYYLILKVNEFLTIESLANLSQVNTRFYNYISYDKIWNAQFERNYKDMYLKMKVDNNSIKTAKEKCIICELNNTNKF